jgi:hypothetical protein
MREVTMTSTITTPDLFAKIIAMADAVSVRDGGFSVDPRTGDDVTGGYAVAVHPECEEIFAQVTPVGVWGYMERHAETLALPGRVMGGWCDPSDGRVYLDVSILVEDRDEAIKLAVDHDQLAIFDFAAGESIKTYP